MSLQDTIKFISDGLREDEIYPKVASMLDYILSNAFEELKDVKSKHRDPDVLSEEVIGEKIKEYGYDYINSIIDTITGLELNILLHFISLIHFLKGHRSGLELILELLGFDSTIKEWWEVTPKKEPHSFDMDIFFNFSQVDNVFTTLNKIRDFVEHYVYPKFQIANITFDFEFVESNVLVSGFPTQQYNTEIVGSI